VTIKIHKGRHRARPLYWLKYWPVFYSPTLLQRVVKFTFSSKYNLQGEDQQDHNKLFGISFGNVHRLSARFGWRYDPAKNTFILSAYCYLNGVRHMDDICECVANHSYTCRLIISHIDYIFQVVNDRYDMIADYHISKGHRRKWALLLGTYFGGNQSAPVDIELEMKRL
jgi:hypothetical protein